MPQLPQTISPLESNKPSIDSTHAKQDSMQTHLAHNRSAILARIQTASELYAKAHNLPSHEVTLIAVSKYQNLASIQALFRAGQRAFGENKVQDLCVKASAMSSMMTETKPESNTPSSCISTRESTSQDHSLLDFTPQLRTAPYLESAPQWHFIGTLQRNKINALLAMKPALIHSIDSIPLAIALNERCARLGIIQRVLLQVNSAYESSKHGFLPESTQEAHHYLQKHAPCVRICGLMSIGAHTDDTLMIEESFARTKELYDTIKAESATIEILSMGMSGDFALAIKHGANMVRIGSALFANTP